MSDPAGMLRIPPDPGSVRTPKRRAKVGDPGFVQCEQDRPGINWTARVDCERRAEILCHRTGELYCRNHGSWHFGRDGCSRTDHRRIG